MKSPAKTKEYWDAGRAINADFVAAVDAIFLAEWRPGDVAQECERAANRLRQLDKKEVDPAVLDHVGDIKVGFETLAGVVKTNGRDELWKRSAEAAKLIMAMASDSAPGATARGGALPFVPGDEQTQRETMDLMKPLLEREKRVIEAIRTKYGIELDRW